MRFLNTNCVCCFSKDRKVNNRPITIEYIFIQMICNKNEHLVKWSIFVNCLMSSLAYPTPFRTRPNIDYHLYMLCMYVATFHCQKGILGLGGASKTN